MKLTKVQKEYIIKLLQEGKELPEEFKYLLFPTKQKEYELVYAGKIRKEDLLANEDGVFPVPLQIDKVFNGERESFDDGWKNMIVFGDNLQFLKTVYENNDPLIKDKVKGKVKLIYIDPPFGTGDEYDGNKGQSAYSAKRKGADFIEFLRRRLILAREILADDGVIVVRNAYNFGHYVKIILDEIFSKENFINEIIINRKRKSMGSRKKYEIANEYLYIYSKTKEYFFENQVAKKPLSKIKWTSFLSQEERNPKERVLLGLTFIPPKGQHFSLKQEKAEKLLKEHFLRIKHKPSGAIFYYSESGNDDTFYKKISTKGKNAFKYQDITVDTEVYGVREIKEIEKFQNCKPEEFKIEYLTRDEEKVTNDWTDIPSYTDTMGYPTENSEQLLKRVIKSFTQSNDLVLDFFAGSGTTAAVAEKLGRRWIAVDIGKFAYYTMQKRILQIEHSKDLENPRKKYGKKARSFMTARLGIYDLKQALDLEWKEYLKFIAELFEFEIKEFEVAGFKFEGKKGEYPVKVFDYIRFKDASVDENYLKNIDSVVGSRLNGRVYIVAPANYVDFIQDYYQIGDIRYYFLKIPYQVIKELHKIPFKKLRQPQSKKNVNDLEEVIGFHFIRQPEIKSELKIEDNVVKLIIKEFRSQYYKDEEGKILDNFETLSAVFIDKSYNGKHFEMDEVYFADELLPKKSKKKEVDIKKELKNIQDEGLVIEMDKKDVGDKVMVIYSDIYGNDFIEILNIEGV